MSGSADASGGAPDPSGRASPAGAASGIAGAAGLVAVVTLAARLVGFGRWLEFSRSIGATCVGTVYQAANSLPNVLFEVAAGGALAAVAVPLIGSALGRGRREEADAIGSALLTWTLLLLVPAAVLLALAAPLVAPLVVDDGQCPGARDLATTMLRVFAPQVPLYGLGIVLAGVLQAHRRFLAAALAPLLSSLVVVGAYALYGALAGPTRDLAALPSGAVAALAGGTTLGVVVLSLPLLVPVSRLGVRLRPTLRLPDGAGRRLGALAGAGLLALVAQQYAVLATIVVTRRAGTGVLNVSTYVQTLYLLPYAVLAVPVAVSAFPALATMQGAAGEPAAGERAAGQPPGGDDAPGRRGHRHGAAAAPSDEATRVLARTARAVLVLGFVGAGVLAAAAQPLGAFFGALDAGRSQGAGRDVLAQLPAALLALLPGLPAFGLAALLTRALYVRGRPFLAGSAVAAGWLIAGSVPLVLVRPGSTPGWALVVLGLSASVGMVVAALDLVAAVVRAWGPDALRGGVRASLAGLAGALVAALAGGLLARGWVVAGLGPSLVQGLVLGVLGLVLVLLVAALVDRDTARTVLARARRRRAPEPADLP
ncbi:lipid II flippase MurJ [Lapillicoccus jejuensis]|uniref:Putative peptidoglycan lipid II flippase n=1 Tax=Lapillicoccus jejuensis TaxID=402171 RepID=A0A542E6Q6_9MICO|nr:lipid II flippase MurJ [Lapillicoccus jejuensis]TQJ10969.1 putative peptidoglycan lipid II flippase [Lapillicoccus jejuensis]